MVSTLPYDATVVTVTGEQTSLESLRNKALLVVNVASKCGLTPQYEQLEQLQRTYGPRGLQVVGFPCNQFAGQEPGTNEQIAEFCSATYGVTFPVFAKIKVNGKKKHPIYAALRTTPDADGKAGRIAWNFEKFLVAPGGEVVSRFRPSTTPDDPRVVAAIESVLPQ
jgi:glutathione peroxidase